MYTILLTALLTLPADCGCVKYYCPCSDACLCREATRCCERCPCEFGFVRFDEPKKLPAKDYSGARWYPVTGKPDFQWLHMPDDTCAGVYQFSSKKWFPLTKATPGAEEYGDCCPCPVTPPAQAPTYYADPFSGQGECANGQCGGASSGRRLFRR